MGNSEQDQQASGSSSGRSATPDDCLVQWPWGSNIARHTGLARHMALDETTKSCVSVLSWRSPEGSKTVEDRSSMTGRWGSVIAELDGVVN